MKYAYACLTGWLLVVVLTAATPLMSAQGAQHVRWDIATVTCTGTPATSGYPCTLDPGGSATATAVDCLIPGVGCSSITMTGSGSFVVPANGGSSNGVTGGGTWRVVAEDGTITSGTYAVTELVQWEKTEPLEVPSCIPDGCLTIDHIGQLSQATGALAVVRVAYSDGTTGVLTLACAGLPDPAAITEGITASKSVILSNVAIPGINVPPLPSDFKTTKVPLPVLFWNPGVFTSFVEFHVRN